MEAQAESEAQGYYSSVSFQPAQVMASKLKLQLKLKRAKETKLLIKQAKAEAF